jgi:GTPase SAR1 family protein
MDIDDKVSKLKIEDEKQNQEKSKKLTMCLIVLGMAGSGKTTFVKYFEEYVNKIKKESYIINLDPAVLETNYEPNLDIRDTINYKEVMKTHNLGPNGSIMTCLNLFTTQIHQIIDVLSKKSDIEYIL